MLSNDPSNEINGDDKWGGERVEEERGDRLYVNVD